MRICVVTFHDLAEPRGPRHAAAAKQAIPEAEVVFIHYRSPATNRPTSLRILERNSIVTRVLEFPTRESSPVFLLWRRIKTKFARTAFKATGKYGEAVFGDRIQGLTRVLMETPADLYFAHNIETLLPAALAAQSHGAALAFDCMEYYSDMGDGQPAVLSRAARGLEARCLPVCSLVVASSDALADALADDYGIARPLAAYNVPPREAELPPRRGGGLNLYWRNTVVGFGQRGLEDALEAMARLPSDIRLFLQGNMPSDGGAAVNARILTLGLGNRVTILPPYLPDEAVRNAAPFDVGLCLERKGPRNHDLTVSNKMFDYHMAGLAVLASDLPGLASVLRRSAGGSLFQPGNPQSLADAILRLHASPELLRRQQKNARAFALREGNLEAEMERISRAIRSVMETHGSRRQRL